ncbi:Alcohol acetyltransferase [Diaporthe australafricana]|uniref:Alcohol acetyltransferase n=1 Tax=Diaporthe australafricana TaxID=127596 RepID=A0ABR3WB31_9PEZI
MANKVKDGQATETKVLRKLGINETYQLAMYLLDQYRGTTLSCRYEIPPKFAPAESRGQLEQAVKVAVVDIIMRHPMLQVSMIDATSKTPSWIQLQSLDLTQHIKWVHLTADDDLERVVDETFRTQLDDRFPDLSIKQPYWKITVIRQGDAPIMEVLLTWNHPWFDAMGAKVFHEDFVEILNADNGAHERTGLDGDVLKLPEAAPLLPTPIEILTGTPVDLKVLARALWEDMRPQFLNRDVSWAAWCPIRPTPYKTQFRAFWMDNASVTAIQALCRQNKTTVTGLINGLALIAFSSHLDAAAAPGFQSSTIVDHRRNLPPAPADAPWGKSDRAVSNYVTQCLHRWEPELAARIRSKLPAADTSGEGGKGGKELSVDLQRELWAASARNRNEIVAKLKTGLQNDLIGLFKYVTDWQQTMGDMAKKKRQFSWLVTNIGVLGGGGADTKNESDGDGQKSNGWSMSRAQFGLSVEVPSAAMELSPVSVAGRGMSVGASWPDCAVDATLAERIMADLERWLAQLATQS